VPHGENPTLRDRVPVGETTFGLFVDLDAPLAAEICGRAGYDGWSSISSTGVATEGDLPGCSWSADRLGGAARPRRRAPADRPRA
jgi:hypothetical protein